MRQTLTEWGGVGARGVIFASFLLSKDMISDLFVFWAAVAIVLLLAFGHTAWRKLSVLNKKHHFIEIDIDSVNVYEDDDDE